MKISILTPTYNRAYVLTNLYKSLIINKKSYANFEWLIMDDGSTDNTKQLVASWIEEGKITIKYFYQSNQGKMVALNNLLTHISGNITIECDSDDYFTNDCFINIIDKWQYIEKDNDVYGLIMLKINKDGKPIGDKFPIEGIITRVFDLYFKNNITGDKCYAFKSNIRKKYYHQLENNERFVTEGRMYHKMDLAYKGLMTFNVNCVICEYLEDGYSKNIIQVFKKYPYGYYKYYLEMFDLDMNGVSFTKRLHIIKHYILFGCLTKQKKLSLINLSKGQLNKILVLVLVIPGYILTKIKFK